MTTIQATVRTFIAIELPSDVQQSLHDTQDRIAGWLGPNERTLRWVRPESLHLTLQFLGDVPIRLIGLIKGAMDKACLGTASFNLHTGQPGVFPNERRPRVLWVGVEGDIDPLRSLANSVHRELQALGYKPDDTFSPHLTLARVRGHANEDARAAIADALASIKREPPPKISFPVTSISLMQSELRQGGSVYTRLRSTDLA
jgi:2'-5' RNA ligase